MHFAAEKGQSECIQALEVLGGDVSKARMVRLVLCVARAFAPASLTAPPHTCAGAERLDAASQRGQWPPRGVHRCAG